MVRLAKEPPVGNVRIFVKNWLNDELVASPYRKVTKAVQLPYREEEYLAIYGR